MLRYEKEIINNNFYLLQIIVADKNRRNNKHINKKLDEIIKDTTKKEIKEYLNRIIYNYQTIDELQENKPFKIMINYFIYQCINYLDTEQIEEHIENGFILENAINDCIQNELSYYFEEYDEE